MRLLPFRRRALWVPLAGRCAMSDLERFRDHCREMAAKGAHLSDCESLRPATRARPRWGPLPDGPGLGWLGMEPAYTPPECDGCVPEADRALFRSMAAEIDDYLTTEDEPLWETP